MQSRVSEQSELLERAPRQTNIFSQMQQAKPLGDNVKSLKSRPMLRCHFYIVSRQ